jgi:chromosome segregation ATPase
MMDIKEITAKLESLQAQADQNRQRRSRLEGEIKTLEKNSEELRKRFREEVGEEIEKAEEIIADQEKKIAARVQEIQNILNPPVESQHGMI